MRQGDAYDAFKSGFSERLLTELYRVQPQLRDNIDYHELSTP